MDLGIGGRVALVTGSSRGLGRATALALVQEGARVVICGRDESRLREAEAALAAYGDVVGVVCDVTQPSSPAELVATAVERFGALDILVANSGGPPPASALELDDDALASALNANLLTSVRLVREAVPSMTRAGWGRICLITSSTVRQPIPTLAASSTARSGLWGWAKAAAGDLFEAGITLNLACPGFHATERMQEIGQTGRGPAGDPADFGRVVAFLCSEPAKFVSGTTVLVDGGRTLCL